MNKKIRQRLGLHFYAVGLWRIFCCYGAIKTNRGGVIYLTMQILSAELQRENLKI